MYSSNNLIEVPNSLSKNAPKTIVFTKESGLSVKIWAFEKCYQTIEV